MKFTLLIILAIGLLFLCSCTVFYGNQSASDPEVQSPKPLVLPAGKSWQITEEAPKISDERGRLPFQTEKSLQPDGAKSVSPADNRKIETTR
jgi:hypothetical protein